MSDEEDGPPPSVSMTVIETRRIKRPIGFVHFKRPKAMIVFTPKTPPKPSKPKPKGGRK